MGEKVVIGMSGGVDSSVAAYLLKKEGYDVIGVTMQIWQDEDNCDIEDNGGCCGLSAVDDARRVAINLDIPYFVLNFKADFKESVIDYFIDEYSKGRTPNPCIACNRYVKWESLLKKSIQLGAKYIATGHYAQIRQVDGRYSLELSKTKEKDQTYALYNLTQEQLAQTLMPVGKYTKDEIRDIAKKIGLQIYDKPDSQEICFIPDDDYGRFIKENSDIDFAEGDFIDEQGNIIGKHKGIVYYTVGQRKGLGAFGKRVYVKKINVDTNEITLTDNESLFDKVLIADNLNHMLVDKFDEDKVVIGKIRYSHKGSTCKINYLSEDKIKVVFDEPQRAITPGQAVVFYENGLVLGGGTIC